MGERGDGREARCSFCDKSQPDVTKLIAGPAVYICNECVAICVDILEEDENSALWESWPSDEIESEIGRFRGDQPDLKGLSEETVRARFGEPDRVGPGTSWGDPSGKIVTKADRDLHFAALMPHVVLSLSMVAGRVALAAFVPKWKRCPEDRRSLLGPWYAPEDPPSN